MCPALIKNACFLMLQMNKKVYLQNTKKANLANFTISILLST